MIYRLPEALSVCGTDHAIRSDFRVALDTFAALNDPDLFSLEKGLVMLRILYRDFDQISPEHYAEAIRQAKTYLNGGEENEEIQRGPQLVDWEKDFPYIAAPVSRIIGQDVRGMEYLHWWSFLSAFYEIGDCTFAQIVRIRKLKAAGKALNKSDAEWYREHRDMVDIKTRYTEEEAQLLQEWNS